MCSITFNWERGDFEEKFDEFPRDEKVLWAVIEITEKCNFGCEWCYANSGNPAPRHMEKSEIRIIIDKLSEAGAKQVTFSGGEPTMHPDILWAVRYAKNRGLIVHMNTNGYLLNRARLLRFKRAGLSQIEMNIDSMSPEKHDRIRGKRGSFERTVNAILDSDDIGMSAVVQTVMTKDNQNEIGKIMRFAISLGAKRFRLWDMILSGAAKDMGDRLPGNYIDTIKSMSKIAKENGAMSIEAGEPLYPLDHDPGMHVIDTPCVCNRGLLLTISQNGDVLFCAMHREKVYNIFDAFKESEDIQKFHKEKLSAYIRGKKLAEECLGCEFVESCRGGCPSRFDLVKGKDYWCHI